MSALGRIVRSGVGRRRVQTMVIGLATMMAVAVSVLGGSLLLVSGAPFDDAFAERHGAHLSVQFDAGEVSAAQLAKSGHAPGVSHAAGPFRTATVTPRSGGAGPGWPMTVVGRGEPGRNVDEVALLDGRWPTRSGEVVLSADSSLIPATGMKLAFSQPSGGPALTVVGVARSVTRTADAWVVPSQMAALTTPGSGGYQMLYRFTRAGSPAQVTAGGRAVTQSLPPGAAVGDGPGSPSRSRPRRHCRLRPVPHRLRRPTSTSTRYPGRSPGEPWAADPGNTKIPDRVKPRS